MPKAGEAIAILYGYPPIRFPTAPSTLLVIDVGWVDARKPNKASP